MQQISERIQPWHNPEPRTGPVTPYINERVQEIESAIATFSQTPTAANMKSAIRVLSQHGHLYSTGEVEAPVNFAKHIRRCDYTLQEILDIRDASALSIPEISRGFGGKVGGGLRMRYVQNFADFSRECNDLAKGLVSSLKETCTEKLCYQDFLGLGLRFSGLTSQSDVDLVAARNVPLSELRPSSFIRLCVLDVLNELQAPKRPEVLIS